MTTKISKPRTKKHLTRGERNAAWIERFCLVPEGAHVGSPVVLRPWQRKEIMRIYDNPHGTRTAILSFGKKNGKGLALDTPIPTPGGWRTMGEIRPGDLVFGADGRPTRVIFVSDVHNLRCWRLTFSDGSSVVADEEHRWMTTHRFRPWASPRVNGSGNGGRWREDVVKTPQIADSIMVPSLSGTRIFNHKIKSAPALQSSDIELPIDPYVLGAWLGDGTSSSERFTSGKKDLSHLVAHLETALGSVSVARYGDKAATIGTAGTGLQSALRALGVLGAKRIPARYFDAGTSQRWALFQGLMDTDGTVHRHAGATTPRCSFTSCDQDLARDVWRLARSLGLKATMTNREAKIGNHVYGTAWMVSFTAAATDPVFRLARKQALLPSVVGKRSKTLSIVSADEVPSVPTVCITVEAPDSLFLCGHGCVPTHNTSMAAFFLLLHLVGPEAIANTQIVSTAQSRDQAAVLFALAAKCVRLNPSLSDATIVRDTRKELVCPELGTTYRALSAEAATAHGQSPVMAIHDELGQVKGPVSELYNAIDNAMGAHANPLSIIISTQAPTDGALLSVLIDDALAGNDPSVVVSLYTAPMDINPFSEKAIMAANPAAGDFLNMAEVKKQAANARRMPSQENLYRNYILNQRVDASAPFISRGVWNACDGPVADWEEWRGVPVFAGLDLSEVSDLTALVLIARIRGAWHVRPTFWLPSDGLVEKSRSDRVPYDLWADQGFLETVPGRTVRYDFVASYIRELFKDLDVRAVAFDRWNWRHFKPWLEQAGFSSEQIEGDAPIFIEFGQGFQSMSPALRDIESAILNGEVVHGGHPVLTMCAANAVVQSDPAGNRKLVKHKSSGRIDGMVALIMAMGVAATHADGADSGSYLQNSGLMVL